MRIRLKEPFDWPIPGTRALKAFPVGDHTMTREQGTAAIAARKGEEIAPPKKGETGDAGNT